MRKIYIAASMLDKKQASDLAFRLCSHEHVVTSSWHEQETENRSTQSITAKNYRDLSRADTLILIANTACRGSLVEVGVAIGRGMYCIAIGDPSDVTLMLDIPGVIWVPNFQEAIARL